MGGWTLEFVWVGGKGVGRECPTGRCREWKCFISKNLPYAINCYRLPGLCMKASFMF